MVSCQSQSWGKFWEVTPATRAASTCASTAIAADSLSMVCIPANTNGFVRGSAAVGGSAIPEHTVASITAFAMAKYEVKFADWLTVKTYAAGKGYAFANVGYQGSDACPGGGSPVGTDQHPVTCISWRDAIVWCNAASEKQGLTPVYYTNAAFTTPLKISTSTGGVNSTAGSEDSPYVNWSANGYRLPTEAEWEYAARFIDGVAAMRGDAPSGWVDSNTDTIVDASEYNAVGWTTANAGGTTRVVGTAFSNALGLFDMSGNVWEWTWDWHAANYSTTTPYTDADSLGPPSGTSRVNRGGGWANLAIFTRSAYRNNVTPWNTFHNIGFRPVRRP